MNIENTTVTELGFETQVRAYPRPKRHDPAIIKKVAEGLVSKVKAWLNDGSNIDDIQQELEDALRHNEDGYSIARKLDSAGYEPDAALVDILDNAGFWFTRALREASVQWVKDCCVQSPPLLAKVIISKNTPIGTQGKIGQIIKNHEDGRSTVRFSDQAEGCGYIIEWERLTVQKD